MSILQWGLGAAVVLLLVVWLVLHRRGAAAPLQEDRVDTVIGWPPQPTRVLNSHERVAYDTLSRALPDHIVLAQVPVSRFLSVPKQNSYADWLRRLGYQCVDFVVCDKASKVIAVVELKPAGGLTSERAIKRAKRMKRVLESAGIPLMVWAENSLPTPELVRDAIMPKAKPASPRPAVVTAQAVTPAADATEPMAAAATVNPFHGFAPDSSQDLTVEYLDPSSSTWFDDLDSEPTPLQKH